MCSGFNSSVVVKWKRLLGIHTVNDLFSPGLESKNLSPFMINDKAKKHIKVKEVLIQLSHRNQTFIEDHALR